MAYAFASASSQYLNAALAASLDYPNTLSAQANVSTTAVQTAISLGGNAAGDTNRRVIFASTRVISPDAGSIQAQEASGATGFAADLVTPVSAGWIIPTGVFSNSSARTIYLNGGNKVTNTSSVNTGSLGNVYIGARWNTSAGVFFTGDLAECAVWSVALTDAEIASLGKGFKPYRIRPQSLVFYAPLIRNIQDTKGGLTITNNNSATVAAHPRVI